MRKRAGWRGLTSSGRVATLQIHQEKMTAALWTNRTFHLTMVDMRHALTGNLLIASPSMGDSRFKRAVILVCDHDDEHAMGIILNRPMAKLTLPKLLDQLGIDCSIKLPRSPVLDGGPCQRIPTTGRVTKQPRRSRWG
jgi:Uncharacterized ACR, COG1678